MSDLVLTRFHFATTYTVGVLTWKGQFLAFTMEDVVRVMRSAADKVHGKTAIPAGNYKIAVTRSNRFKRDLIEIQNVPYFEGIRIHSGNTAGDSEGCPIIGDTWSGDRVMGGKLRGIEVKVTEIVRENKVSGIRIVEVK